MKVIIDVNEDVTIESVDNVDIDVGIKVYIRNPTNMGMVRPDELQEAIRKMVAK